jgi:hypothetical protein
MRHLSAILAAGILACFSVATQAQSVLTPLPQTIPVGRFHKVIVSPYIQATFVEGDAESVTISNTIVDSGKLHVEVNGGTLRIYLDGAKDIPHYEREYRSDGSSTSHPLYPNHAVIVTVTYRKLDALSLRGDETFLCQSPISAKNFTLRIYSNPKVIFTEVHLTELHTTIYGDATLDIRSGEAFGQYYTAYGDGRINVAAIKGQTAKLTAFGEAEFRLNVSDWIKVTSFGEARVRYLGNPEIVKGMNFGNVNIKQLDSADVGRR